MVFQKNCPILKFMLKLNNNGFHEGLLKVLIFLWTSDTRPHPQNKWKRMTEVRDQFSPRNGLHEGGYYIFNIKKKSVNEILEQRVKK